MLILFTGGAVHSPPPIKYNTMKVQFIKPHSKYSYFPGEIATVDSEEAQELIKGRFAIPVEETQTATLPQAETATQPRKPKK